MLEGLDEVDWAAFSHTTWPVPFVAVIIELSPAGQDTNFTLTVCYTPRFGPIGALIDRAVRGSITHSQQRSAKAFAALVARENSSS